MSPDDRYHRQRLLPELDQARIAAATVLVLGAGALGNHLLMQLALAGVGRLLVVDFDHIEGTNLHRMPLFRARDVGAPKAEVCLRALSELAPDARVEAICEDFRFGVGLGRFRRADVVAGCLDSVQARVAAARACALAPRKDCQTEISSGWRSWSSLRKRRNAPLPFSERLKRWPVSRSLRPSAKSTMS